MPRPSARIVCSSPDRAPKSERRKSCLPAVCRFVLLDYPPRDPSSRAEIGMAMTPRPLADRLEAVAVRRRALLGGGLRPAFGSRSRRWRPLPATTASGSSRSADQLLQLIVDLLAVLGAQVEFLVAPVEAETDRLDTLGVVVVQVARHDHLYLLRHGLLPSADGAVSGGKVVEKCWGPRQWATRSRVLRNP